MKGYCGVLLYKISSIQKVFLLLPSDTFSYHSRCLCQSSAKHSDCLTLDSLSAAPFHDSCVVSLRNNHRRRRRLLRLSPHTSAFRTKGKKVTPRSANQKTRKLVSTKVYKIVASGIVPVVTTRPFYYAPTPYQKREAGNSEINKPAVISFISRSYDLGIWTRSSILSILLICTKLSA